MNENLSAVYVVRHGETAWSLSGQHTGRTDIPLTERGEHDASRLRERLADIRFSHVFTGPQQRARRTCELAGHGKFATVDPDLAEWDYGKYEGVRTADIRKDNPDWQLFRDGAPGGESVDEVGARADRVLSRVRPLDGNVLVFSSGHLLRVLAARWLGLPPADGRLFVLRTTTLSVLGYEHNENEPALLLWNESQDFVTVRGK